MASYRAVLEVLKLTEEKDVLEHTELVSQTWKLASASHELWLNFIYENRGLECGYRNRGKHGREQYKYLHYLNTCLVQVTYEEVQFYHCTTGRIVRVHSLPEPIYDITNSAQVLLLDLSLLITGGGADMQEDEHRKAIRIADGRVSSFTTLPTGRRCHGIALYSDSIYLFGGLSGRSGCSSSSDAFSLTDNQWKPVPDMISSRAKFSPVTFFNRIYLCGGLFTYDSEVFDPETRVYLPLPFSLPKISDCASVFLTGTLIVLTNEYIVRWNPGETEATWRLRDSQSCVYGPMNAVAKGNRVYLLGWEGLIAVDLDKRTTRKLA